MVKVSWVLFVFGSLAKSDQVEDDQLLQSVKLSTVSSHLRDLPREEKEYPTSIDIPFSKSKRDLDAAKQAESNTSSLSLFSNPDLDAAKQAEDNTASLLQSSAGCGDSPSGWYDSDGPTYNCAWYAYGDRCNQYGDYYHGTWGKSAKTACCACGGGSSIARWVSCYMEARASKDGRSWTTQYLRKYAEEKYALFTGTKKGEERIALPNWRNWLDLRSTLPGSNAYLVVHSHYPGSNSPDCFQVEWKDNAPVDGHRRFKVEKSSGGYVKNDDPVHQKCHLGIDYSGDHGDRLACCKKQTAEWHHDLWSTISGTAEWDGFPDWFFPLKLVRCDGNDLIP